ncbi:protein translocase subunit SecD [Lachnoclostridium sp. Marseille-P6806]|uniref:protein translocase subunit SecD n=1 Tax=Lachnoclostridium sp. Marseille-P6806 TaxID=2364793 RepID=UPI0010301284|nr:protein translocase subunit SecD [Lachnoclostridium sp. Marseille-P6806]
MKKRNAVIALLLAVVLFIGAGYLALVGIGLEGSGSIYDIRLGLDLAGGVSITYQAVGEETPSAEDMDDTVYKLQKRVEQYSTEAQVYKEGDDRVNIEIPGVTDANSILEDLGKPGSLYFIRQTDADGNANYQMNSSTYQYELTRSLDDIIETGDAVLSGTDVADAQAGYQNDSMSNQEIVVELTFTDDGAKKFADATTSAYGKGESIGIYYDGEFISVPRVQAAITNGQAVITGESTIEDARELASTIRIGGLKVELEELRSNVVGAQLGQNAIDTSLKAGVVGLILVVVFMCVVYWLPGLCASLALLFYTFLMILILNAFEVTLTLPGIAGILLSIGMAVDANCIIFARIREELATGKTVSSAMNIGYSKALSAIIDGNVTTLIAAAVLGLRGSGTVKGFAQTLAIGIILSMFTALFVTKLLMKAAYALGFKDLRFYGVGREHDPVKFIGRRRIFFAASALVILAGFAGMFFHAARGERALNYSLDFVGGTSTSVTFDRQYTLDELDAEVVPVFQSVTGDANVQVQTVANSNQVIFKTRTLRVEEREKLDSALEEQFSIPETDIQSETISSTISREMKSDALSAVLIAMALMLLYIWFRFKDARFGVSSVAALAHDVLVVLACYALLRVPVGSTFIACMLTIVGYSINATIVIFDRVRENLQIYGSGDLETIADRSITQTLSRSIFTSLTTFFMVFVLYIFGVSSIREFALPIGVGVISGTYSSICLASAFWFVLRRHAAKVRAKKPAAVAASGEAGAGGKDGRKDKKTK